MDMYHRIGSVKLDPFQSLLKEQMPKPCPLGFQPRLVSPPPQEHDDTTAKHMTHPWLGATSGLVLPSVNLRLLQQGVRLQTALLRLDLLRVLLPGLPAQKPDPEGNRFPGGPWNSFSAG